jgi:hypothetical protein
MREPTRIDGQNGVSIGRGTGGGAHDPDGG